MPEDKPDEKSLEDFTKGSRSFLKKANALMKAVRWLLKEGRKGKRSPITLYLETDSVPVAVQIDATVMETDAEGVSPDVQ